MYLKGVRVSIRGGYRDKQNLNRDYNLFFIKSLCIELCVVERKNRFIFKNQIPSDVLPLNTAKIYRFELKSL